jgi:uncharacterized protein (TIGR02246 family)
LTTAEPLKIIVAGSGFSPHTIFIPEETIMSKLRSRTGRNRLLLAAALVLATLELAGSGGLGAPPRLADQMDRTSHSRSADEAALRSLIAAGGEAWNRGDAKGLASIWAEDGELVPGNGSYYVGRPQITDCLAALLSGPWKGSRFVFEVTSVRFLGTDVAVMHLNSAFLKAGELEPALGNRATQSIIATRKGSMWRVALYQSTRVSPPSPTHN